MPILENIKSYILNPIIGLMFGLALVFFLFGLVQYLYQGKVGENRAQAVRNIVWGVVGMTIMLSVYGIMQVIIDTINSIAPAQ